MGKLSAVNESRTCFIEAESLIGRATQCSVRIAKDYVSGQHATLRWTGTAWEIIDLDSRNGTWLGEQRLEPRKPYPVPEGALLSFGHPQEVWRLLSAAAPRVMVVNVITQEQIVANDAVLGIPSDAEPQATLYKSLAGSWCLELEDGREQTLENGAIFDVGHQAWRFCCPDAIASTVTRELGHDAEPFTLHFRVSQDEEYVEILLEFSDRVLHLGSRSQNHLLLTLARARLRDAENGVPETSCGWMYKEDLVSGVEAPQRVDNDVFRIRKHFAEHAPTPLTNIVERRPRTRQLRIGIADLRITSL